MANPQLPRGKSPPRNARRDPRQRHTDGLAPWQHLTGEDPDKKYVWVCEAFADTGPDLYAAQGYEVETYSVDGVAPKGGRTGKPGEIIKYRGHILMSVSKERAEEIDRYGADGNGGQERIDEIENLIHRSGSTDGFGRYHRGIRVGINEDEGGVHKEMVTDG